MRGGGHLLWVALLRSARCRSSWIVRQDGLPGRRSARCFVELNFPRDYVAEEGKLGTEPQACLGIPMMSISHSDLMPIRSERSDAGLSQCETVIGIPSRVLLAFLALMLGSCCLFGPPCFWALTQGARRATGVSAQKHSANCLLLAVFGTAATSLLPHRLSL